MSAVAVTSVLPPSSRALRADHATSPSSCLRHARCHRSPLHLHLAQHASCSCPPPRCALGDFTGDVYYSRALAWLHSCRPVPSLETTCAASVPSNAFPYPEADRNAHLEHISRFTNQVTRSNGFLDTVSTLGNAHASTPLRESARPVNKSWLCLSGLMRASRQYRSRLGPLG